MVVFLRLQFIEELQSIHLIEMYYLSVFLGPGMVLGYNGEKIRHRSFLSSQSLKSNFISKTLGSARENHVEIVAPLGNVTFSQRTETE